MNNKKKTVGYAAAISITLTALIAGFCLSFVNAKLSPEIEANRIKTVMDGIKIVIPNAKTIEGPIEKNGLTYYKGLSDENKIEGYAIFAHATGYQGKITLLVGYNADLSSIVKITPVEHAETPGLGANMSKEYFTKQFENKPSDTLFSVVKNKSEDELADNEINAMTGATVTSRAVVDAIMQSEEDAKTLK